MTLKESRAEIYDFLASQGIEAEQFHHPLSKLLKKNSRIAAETKLLEMKVMLETAIANGRKRIENNDPKSRDYRQQIQVMRSMLDWIDRQLT